MNNKLLPSVLILLICMSGYTQNKDLERHRIRHYGIEPGILQTGKLNAITDVKGVKVGQTTLIKGDSIRTGVTVIIPHEGIVFQEKVPAGVYVGNGFGKMMGTTQIEELGNIETPIALTNTMNTPIVANAIIDYVINQPGNEHIYSVNSIVGETNDGALNDIRGRHVKDKHVKEALKKAKGGLPKEGNVGAGTGTQALGFKGGIGTSSRVLPKDKGGYSVGVLTQTNFGGILTINGAPVGKEMDNYYMSGQTDYKVDGSVMIVIATDAPLSSRNLKRLAKRSFLALGKVGSFSSNGSGDYSIAFSTHKKVRIPYSTDSLTQNVPRVHNDNMSPLFLAVLEATEEAIYNSLFMAKNMKGFKGREAKAIPIKETLKILNEYGVIK